MNDPMPGLLTGLLMRDGTKPISPDPVAGAAGDADAFAALVHGVEGTAAEGVAEPSEVPPGVGPSIPVLVGSPRDTGGPLNAQRIDIAYENLPDVKDGSHDLPVPSADKHEAAPDPEAGPEGSFVLPSVAQPSEGTVQDVGNVTALPVMAPPVMLGFIAPPGPHMSGKPQTGSESPGVPPVERPQVEAKSPPVAALKVNAPRPEPGHKPGPIATPEATLPAPATGAGAQTPLREPSIPPLPQPVLSPSSPPVAAQVPVTDAALAAPPAPDLQAEVSAALKVSVEPLAPTPANPLAAAAGPALVAVPAPPPAPQTRPVETAVKASEPGADAAELPTESPPLTEAQAAQDPLPVITLPADLAPRTAVLTAPEPGPLPERIQPADLIRQIDASVTRTDSGTVEVSLNPKELGQLTIRIEVQQNDTRMIFAADRPETLQLLKTHQGDLQNALISSGFTQLDLSFTDSAPQQRQPAAEPAEIFAEPVDSPPELPRWATIRNPASTGRYDRRI